MLKGTKKKTAKRKSTKKIAKRRNPEVTDAQIKSATKDIMWPHEGPITNFVILYRAMKLSASGTHTPDALANAVYKELFD